MQPRGPQSKRLHGMDRLPPVGARLFLLVTLLLGGCEDGGAQPRSTGRVVAVTATQPNESDLEAFCDARSEGSAARQLVFPPIDSAVQAQNGRWRWVNVWATWCRPCVEEMPMLISWQRRLEGQHHRVELLFLSVDETAEAVQEFRRSHPATPPTLRLTDQEALEGWITSMGLDAGATLPLHLFSDPNGRLRCARSGALDPSHYQIVQHLMSQNP